MNRPSPGADRRPGIIALAKKSPDTASGMIKTASGQHTAIQETTKGAPGNAFLSYIDHEVQQPMSGIAGMIELLKGTSLTLEQSTYIALIQHNAERLMTMITDVFDMSRIHSANMELESIDFDLRMMLKDIAQHISARAAEKFLSYQYTISPAVPSRFKGDPGRIRRVLMCLLENAIRYTSEGRVKLHVKTRPGGTDRTIVVFEITDSGMNISETRREQLFASFNPSGQPMSPSITGPGTGLCIARQLCQMMGGEVRLEDRHKESARITFTVRLEKASDGNNFPAASQTELSNLRVLVVDDSVTQRKVLKKQLISWGCRYEGVPDGWRAIQALRKAATSGDPFQIAIVDMALPDMNGEAIGQRIKRDPSIRDTRLMMIAMIGKRGDARKFQDIGFSAYLVKPLSPLQLGDSLRMMMDRQPAGAAGETSEIITRHTLMENLKKKIRVLFIDPDAAMQASGRMLLKNLGYHSDPARSGEEAISSMKKHAYDLVIMEMNLPEMDGYAFIYRVRGTTTSKTPPDVPILCFTAAEASDAVDRSFRAGANAVLTKPFAADALERMIAAMVAPHPISEQGKPAAVFDENWIREQLGDNQDMIRALIKGFMEKFPMLIRQLKKETRAKNAERIRQLGDILKGTSAAIGAHALYRIAFQVEVTGQNAAYSMMPALIRNLEDAFGELMDAMDASPFTIPSMKRTVENNAGEAEPVNMDVVMEIFGNNHELLYRFFSDFMRNSEGIMADIQDAVARRDAEPIRLNAHKLKGSLRYLAADIAIACATELETISRNGDLEKADEAFALLVAAYQNIRRFISGIQTPRK